jgi:integrase
MARKKKGPVAHTGKTEAGNTRDLKIERIGPVTIYKRGSSYYLYYREASKTERRRVDGNLAVARATAAKVAAALGEKKPSPLGFERTTPRQMVDGYLDYVANVQKLAWRTEDRYRAALDRFLDFCGDAGMIAIDVLDDQTIEDFVRWLRGQTRTRNGAKTGKRNPYRVGGVKFILSTCRTAMNWAARRRMLPPYAENAFSRFSIDQLRDPSSEDEGQRVFTPEQEQAFFAACTEWQQGIFMTLATYGMRAGELTHLLIENVDLDRGTIQICSKPELFWRVKTARRRQLPLTAEMKKRFERLIGDRKAGFVFLNQQCFTGKTKHATRFESDAALRRHLERIAADYAAENPNATERDKRRVVASFCRKLGQIKVKGIQSEFCKLTRQIGCPEFTRVHDLRHLFSSRAQEEGANPLLVQDILGHANLNMTKRYTHLGMDAKRDAIERITPGKKSNQEDAR